MENMVSMFNSVYKNKKVLITGHTGFKGSWLAEWLISLGAEVFGYSKDIPSTPSNFEVCQTEKRIKHELGDVRDLMHFSNYLEAICPDFVFHLAAQPIVKLAYQNPIETIGTNVLGTANVLEALKEYNHPCSVVIITSDKCYQNVEWTWGYREIDRLGGDDPYSASKGAAELIFHTYHASFFNHINHPVRITSARAGNVIGGGDWADSRLVPDAFRAWARKEKVVIRSPHSTRPWQHVLEPLSGYLRLGQLLSEQPTLNGESFNFGPPSKQNHTVLELLEALEKIWGTNDQIITEQNTSFHEAGLLKLNCDKALHHLQWQPTLSFEETTSFTADWYKKYYQDENNFTMREYTLGQIEKYSQLARQKNQVWSV